jgi:hypothetical protein
VTDNSLPADGPASGRPVEVPRYLAGPGVLEVLDVWQFLFDQGWSKHTPATGLQLAMSPCQRVRAGYRPNTVCDPYAGQWTVAVQQDPFGPVEWSATFSADTPGEVVADFHRELLSAYLDDAFTDGPVLQPDLTDPSRAYLPLLNAGWTHMVSNLGTQRFSSPDGIASLSHFYGTVSDPGSVRWRLLARWGDEPLWTARFSNKAPVYMVDAFTTSLCAKGALSRTAEQLPEAARSILALKTYRSRAPAVIAPVPSPAAGSGPAPRR